MDYEGGTNQDMAYDLRQRYAKIVGDHLDDIAQHRKEKNYSEYFRALEDLYTIVQHKFKETKKKKKKEEEDKPKYKDLRQTLIDTANDNEEAWKGSSQEPDEIAEVEKALRKVEEYLLFKMDEANMFGSKRETEGLI